MKIFLPFHITELVKSLPFYIAEVPFRAEPPLIGHYREYPPGLPKYECTDAVIRNKNTLNFNVITVIGRDKADLI